MRRKSKLIRSSVAGSMCTNILEFLAGHQDKGYSTKDIAIQLSTETSFTGPYWRRHFQNVASGIAYLLSVNKIYVADNLSENGKRTFMIIIRY